MDRFVVEPDAVALGLGQASACLISAAEPFPSTPLPSEEFEVALDAARSAVTSPGGDGYKGVLAALGYPNVEPAGQRLVRLTLERGWRTYGLLVDACNVVALKYAAGIGLHDVGRGQVVGRELAVWRASGDESIVPAFRNTSRKVPAGDLVYGTRGPTGTELLAWLGKRDVDAAIGQVGPETSHALVVALGHSQLTSTETMAMCTAVADLVRRHQPEVTVTPLTTVLSG